MSLIQWLVLIYILQMFTLTCQMKLVELKMLVQVDQENRMTSFFWRDGRSRIDYDCFRDVVVFDKTYHETAASFTWLFKSFLQSICSQSPKTIMTDQDHAISKSIGEIFPDSCHILCL
ncbi:hypothetical protein Gohar_021783 [Gossypium harknessii]|uniref:MULE transposase domain-containing protein n=1 Tax=Gossypium harknessii TaxID=34285 RepID=A0A7J9I8H3_9ROSI|nr:hypothetical protein [Gossypium harknessii]